MLDSSKDWFPFKVSREKAFKYQEDKGFVWGKCTALSAPNVHQAVSLISWENRTLVFNSGVKWWAALFHTVGLQGEENQCKCGVQPNYSFHFLHSLHSAPWIFLLKHLLRPMEVCRKQNLMNFSKLFRGKSILNIHAKKLLNPSALILFLFKNLCKIWDGEKKSLCHKKHFISHFIGEYTFLSPPYSLFYL